MKIIFLGTGASISGGTRLNTSLLIDQNHWKMMVDCSGFPENALARQGVSISDINELVVTHSHVDHMYAVPSLIHAVRISRKPVGGGHITIHAKSEVRDKIQALINTFGLMDKKDPVRIRYRELIQDTGELETGNREILIAYFPVDHGSTPAIGLSIQHQNNHVLFSGDSAVSKNIRNRITPGTILIHDCAALTDPQGNHAGAGELAEMLEAAPCRKLYLSHLPYATEEQLEEAVTIIGKKFSGEIVIPEDGEEICF